MMEQCLYQLPIVKIEFNDDFTLNKFCETMRLLRDWYTPGSFVELKTPLTLKMLDIGLLPFNNAIPEGLFIEEKCIQKLCKLPNLEAFKLDSIELKPESAQYLSFSGLTALKKLILTNNKIETGAEMLSVLTNLNELTINDIDLAPTHFLTQLTNLTMLDIADCAIQAADLEVISTLTNLTALYMFQNKTGTQCTPYLAPLTTLKILNIGDNELKKAAPKMLSMLTNLETLDISFNDMASADAQFILSLTKLRRLSVAGNILNSKFTQSLSLLTNLEALDIRDVSVKGKQLSFLNHLTNLKNLYLNETLVQKGAQSLSMLTNPITLHIAERDIEDSDNERGSEDFEVPLVLRNLRTLSISYDPLSCADPIEY